MNNAIVYSFHVRSGTVKELLCYKQLKYSIDTLRRFNNNIPVYIYISPSNINTKNLQLGENITIVKFDVRDDDGWPKGWEWKEFLQHRWENAIKAVLHNKLDNALYLDTDTVFSNNPQTLFDKYGSTEYMWAKPDNSYDLMKKVDVWPGMNDGQFIISKEVANVNILKHMKFYVNHILSKHKENLTKKEFNDLSWVCTQYAVWDYFEHQKNSVRYFDEFEVMIGNETEFKDISNLVLHHYYSGNTTKFVPQEYL
jgi:hypothetical protein